MNTQSTPLFQGFNKPEANFFRLPNEWTDITANISSLAEMKVVEYVLRHMWGYSEYDIVKKITTDEFMHGRKGEDENERNDVHSDVKNLHIGGRNVHSSYVKSLHRSEKDTRERYNNVTKYKAKDKDEVAYYAGLLADKLNDQKSLTYYKIACQRFHPQKLLEKAAEIIVDGGARNPGAVFADWLKQQ